jgi:hypothetical protein
MPIRIFQNENGKLRERKDLIETEKTNGWWCTVFQSDVDGDGDMDYVFGNAGTNLQFRASEDKPVQLHTGDFNQDGTLDPLLSYYVKDKSYPLASRDEVLDQIATLRKKFIKYEDYANATVKDIATEEQLEKSYKFNAYKLESSWLENLEGESFNLRPLPLLAQFSSVNGFLHDDLDNDGIKDLLVAGNFFPFKPQLGRSDASMGLVLNYHHGEFTVSNNTLSNVWLTGDIRDVALLTFKSGVKRVIVSRNDDSVGVYSLVK